VLLDDEDDESNSQELRNRPSLSVTEQQALLSPIEHKLHKSPVKVVDSEIVSPILVPEVQSASVDKETVHESVAVPPPAEKEESRSVVSEPIAETVVIGSSLEEPTLPIERNLFPTVGDLTQTLSSTTNLVEDGPPSVTMSPSSPHEAENTLPPVEVSDTVASAVINNFDDDASVVSPHTDLPSAPSCSETTQVTSPLTSEVEKSLPLAEVSGEVDSTAINNLDARVVSPHADLPSTPPCSETIQVTSPLISEVEKSLAVNTPKKGVSGRMSDQKFAPSQVFAWCIYVPDGYCFSYITYIGLAGQAEGIT
jgi:hypothetical protein